LRTAAKIALLAIIVWALVRFGGFGFVEVKWVLNQPLLIVCAVLCVWASQLVGAYRFQLILRQQGIRQDLFSLVMLTCASQFTANVLLGTIGGDGIRYLLLAPRNEASAVASLTAIALDRLLGLLGLLAIGIVALCLRLDLVASSHFASRLLLAASAVGVGVAALAFVLFGGRLSISIAESITRRLKPGRLARLIEALGRSVALIAKDPWLALRGFVLSILANLFPLIGFYTVAVMMPQMTMTPLEFGFAMPTALLANSLSITPGGLGAGEATFDFFARLVTAAPLISFAALFFSFRLIAAAATLPGIVPLLLARQARASAAAGSTLWKAGAESR
jgi:glycosyltransferase 2 family protein